MLLIIVWKMFLFTMWCSPLTFQPQNHTCRIGYTKIIPYVNFEHFRIFRFLVMFRTNRQTNKQTESQNQPSYPRWPTESRRQKCCLLGDRGTCVWTTCWGLLHKSGPPAVEPAMQCNQDAILWDRHPLSHVVMCGIEGHFYVDGQLTKKLIKL